MVRVRGRVLAGFENVPLGLVHFWAAKMSHSALEERAARSW